MHKACPLKDLAPGDSLRLDTVPPIAVFHTEEGELFALDDTCTHQDASLADGYVEDCEVECPLHASKFNLRTGAVDAPPAKLPVRTHVVTVVDGDIMVEESAEAPNLPPGLTANGHESQSK
ncbi:bifunctional 3-phenylpropionate/cinnamic acid dioxygenase ferredoxin subunit [Kocuria aegyptia]|uniref:Bifunctional 3-phenylpropionate/cinnamic acid dioxygenase ferredoxin subunit n=1 Tax=Kocuria aegyptia TaxID=330943 RepID=A0ABN2KWJ7_9MICC